MIRTGMEVLTGEASIRWLQQLIGIEHPLLFRILTLPGSTWGILAAMAIGLWWFGRRPAIAVVVAIAVAAPLRLGLALLVGEPRPSGHGIVVLDPETLPSFPSGHTFHAVVAFGVLAALTGFPTWLAVLVALATAVSRVYLGAHFPVDVLGSLVLGALAVWGFVRIWPRIEAGLAAVPAGVWRVAGRIGVVAVAFGAVLLDPARLQTWETLGLLAGGLAVLALPATAPAGTDPGTPLPRLAPAVGAAGLLAGLLLARTVGSTVPWIGGVAMAAATLWTAVVTRRPVQPRDRASNR